MNKVQTFGEMYNDYLNEMYQEALDKIFPLHGCRVSRLIEENAPTDWRCGFVDWLDSLENVTCTDCGERVLEDYKDDVTSEDDVVCGVCVGTHFVCAGCGEVLPNSVMGGDCIVDTCKACEDLEAKDEE